MTPKGVNQLRISDCELRNKEADRETDTEARGQREMRSEECGMRNRETDTGIGIRRKT